jgi:hypothetical protein
MTDKLQDEVEDLKRKNDVLAKALGRLLGRHGTFICGQTEDELYGFPRHIYVCPQLGSDSMALYRLDEDHQEKMRLSYKS